VQEYQVRSVIDVGCGEGYMLRYLADELGLRQVIGVDGVPQKRPNIVTHDYSAGPLYINPTNGRVSRGRSVAPHPWADLIWSCEFVEHVEEKYLRNYLATFACGSMVLMTHADPGQQGHHHVNCQTADYWRGVMAATGFYFDEQLTAVTRELSRENSSPYNHYSRSGLAFRRYGEEDA
jgi:trans-aconitate methyltransferase